MPITRILLFIAVAIGFSGAMAYIWLWGPQATTHAGGSFTDGISQVYTGTPPQPPKYALNILFVGNSYTYFHNMPALVADIAAHDPGNITELRVQSITKGGGDLEGLWNAGQAARLIAGAKWNYVVLQEESFWALQEASVSRAYKYFSAFNDLVLKDNARSILFLSWAYGTGGNWYRGKYAAAKNPDYMQAAFNKSTYDIAMKLNTPVAPLGYYWQIADHKKPPPNLREGDAHHPNLAGTYLNALVFYSLFTGRPVSAITWAPDGLSPDLAAEVRAIASTPMSTR